MADSQPTSGHGVTLPELIALNDEILALVRAGVPLDAPLRQCSRELTGRNAAIAARLAQQLGQGMSLSEALASSGVRFPDVYLAVVEAGLQSGRLSAALETVARSTRRLAESRRTVVASLIYPLFVFLIAWALFAFFMAKLGPAFLMLFDDKTWLVPRFLQTILPLNEYESIWAPLVPLVMIAAFVGWAVYMNQASLLHPALAGRMFGWLPWLGPMVRAYRQGAFAELLWILVEHDLPLPKAIRLAAEAVGTKETRRGAEQIAAAIQRGEKLAANVGRTPGFGPVLEWLLRSGHDRGTLRSALRHAADVYQRRAQRLATSAQLYLAPLMTLLLGGTVTLAYTGLMFGVWLSLLNMVSGW